ncbi:hypothetical protein PoMZ_10057 [Pyricularia oryzae]|uniref:Uncharacterized protein n=1 Tax=Pyricularia oryzae TaxID=318829 RepID=A0A4P7MW66_PYROR|nr:hypothetical protein PoMZ_10057 [Pyricularia oryzae]
MQRSITKNYLSRKDAQRRRTVVQKLHQLECNGFDVWSYMKKGDNVFVYHSPNRAGPPSSTDQIEGNPTSLLCDAKSLEPSKKNNTSEMFQDRTEDLVAGTAKNSSHSSQCASDAMKDSVPMGRG